MVDSSAMSGNSVVMNFILLAVPIFFGVSLILSLVVYPLYSYFKDKRYPKNIDKKYLKLINGNEEYNNSIFSLNTWLGVHSITKDEDAMSDYFNYAKRVFLIGEDTRIEYFETNTDSEASYLFQQATTAIEGYAPEGSKVRKHIHELEGDCIVEYDKKSIVLIRSQNRLLLIFK